MFYTVYKITNNINNKIYIGTHRTDDINDQYMGSGELIINAIKKYGINNFKKEILAIFDKEDEMFDLERELVNKDFVNRSDTYNLNEGGNGHWSKKAQEQLLWKMNNDIEWRKNWLERHSKSKKELYKTITHNRYGTQLTKETKEKISSALKEFYSENPATFLGKHHTTETKKKIGQANSKHQTGKGNSQYGTMWIHSLKEKRSKKINKNDFSEWESKGWLKGRKMKFL